MAKYIEAEELINALFQNVEDLYQRGWNDALRLAINYAPTADVQKVRHGRWEYTKELYRDPNGTHLFYGKICSECNSVSPYDSPYCMNCGANMQQGVTLVGAKMDEVEE